LSGLELNNVMRATLSELLKAGPGIKLHMPSFKWFLLAIGVIIAIAVILLVSGAASSPLTPENWPVI
ncbi:unnamed protein product, partial [marine sediment metagenome]